MRIYVGNTPAARELGLTPEALGLQEYVVWATTNGLVLAGRAEFLRARTLAMADFEDAVVASLAEASQCRHVITRNVGDFDRSPVPAITPEEFLASLSAS